MAPGMQVAQATHAAFAISQAYPDDISRWYIKSNYLVVLSSHNLAEDADRIEEHPLNAVVRVHEPDLEGNPLVAVACRPGPFVGRLVSMRPLALKSREPAMAT